VTGDGINDIDALRFASVGFAMGSGVSAAKDAADMILLDDNFEATMKAVMWGRNIYDNVRRFIQFQVTVNFSVLCVEFFGAATYGDVPLGTVQLLWINLIMDTFAALALASEKPHPSIIRSPPVKKGDLLMTKVMWRQIYGVTVWTVGIMCILLIFGKWLWDLDFSKNDEFYVNGKPTEKCVMYTILFETFVFMQIFNEFNARCI
jgi:magnesium-transporting ATPase (P-type)